MLSLCPGCHAKVHRTNAVLSAELQHRADYLQPVIRESRESSDREMVLMRWGLIPYFPKSLADFKGISTINARAESIEQSPTWRAPF